MTLIPLASPIAECRYRTVASGYNITATRSRVRKTSENRPKMNGSWRVRLRVIHTGSK
jgi:hypothetical protein